MLAARRRQRVLLVDTDAQQAANAWGETIAGFELASVPTWRPDSFAEQQVPLYDVDAGHYRARAHRTHPRGDPRHRPARHPDRAEPTGPPAPPLDAHLAKELRGEALDGLAVRLVLSRVRANTLLARTAREALGS